MSNYQKNDNYKEKRRKYDTTDKMREYYREYKRMRKLQSNTI